MVDDGSQRNCNGVVVWAEVILMKRSWTGLHEASKRSIRRGLQRQAYITRFAEERLVVGSPFADSGRMIKVRSDRVVDTANTAISRDRRQTIGGQTVWVDSDKQNEKWSETWIRVSVEYKKHTRARGAG